MNPPATLSMAQMTERIIFPLQGLAKDNNVLNQFSFVCFKFLTSLFFLGQPSHPVSARCFTQTRTVASANRPYHSTVCFFLPLYTDFYAPIR